MSGRSSPASSARRRGGCVAGALLAWGVVAGGALGSGCGRAGGHARHGDPLRVAAAADLGAAFKDVSEAFEKETGKKVETTFGSTGLLAKQIGEGAPFDVFAAANVSFVDDVVKKGACVEESKALYAQGRIVVWSKDPARLPTRLEELADPRYAHLSMANPEHAPYGRAAQQALKKVGAWDRASARVVYGENVQQAMMFAQTDNADVAIVALSLVKGQGAYFAIDPALHDPLDQALVVCKGGSRGAKSNEARAFVEFVGSPAGRTIMRRYGFLLPGESTAPPPP